MRLVRQPCPDCGGPPMPPAEVTDVRYCPMGIALVVSGRTVDHLSGWKALTIAGSLTLLAADAGMFVLDGDPRGTPEVSAA